MSRFHNRNFELLEPYEGKLSRTVLRGVGSSNAPDLLDQLGLSPNWPTKKADRPTQERGLST